MKKSAGTDMVLTLYRQECPNKLRRAKATGPRWTMMAEGRLCQKLTFDGCEGVYNEEIMRNKDGKSFCEETEGLSAV